jgi:hypothetical protein
LLQQLYPENVILNYLTQHNLYTYYRKRKHKTKHVPEGETNEVLIQGVPTIAIFPIFSPLQLIKLHTYTQIWLNYL